MFRRISCVTKRYLEDFGYRELTNIWEDVAGAANPIYVVQTNTEVVKRCMLMTTEPGDLVIDPPDLRKWNNGVCCRAVGPSLDND